MDRARELAEKDLAAVPPEEQRPVLVDPGDARRALARARRAAAEAREGVESAPRAAVAAAESAPPPVAAPERAPRRVYADEERAPAYPAEERDAGREVAAGDDAAVYPDDEREAPVARDLRARQARQVYADDRPEPAAPRDLRTRQAREIYAEDAPMAAPREEAEPPLARDLPARAPRRVYADDDRTADPAYPAEDEDGRAPRPGDRYAIVDRSLRPDAGRADGSDPQWGARNANPICAGDRADRLLRSVRRKADFERIDGPAAEDLEDEIGHAADLERSYCQSGMNDWREQRLDRLYAQIEDRIRYEEDRRWRR
jgi:hypothetical protein